MKDWEPDHDPTGDQMERKRFQMIAGKIEADPGLLSIPLANMERWLANGHHAKREFAQWREWIEAARGSAPPAVETAAFL